MTVDKSMKVRNSMVRRSRKQLDYADMMFGGSQDLWLVAAFRPDAMEHGSQEQFGDVMSP